MTAKSDGSGGATLIFACSGGPDAGCLADLGVREAAKRGAGKMYCLAGIGGGAAPTRETTRSAVKILAINGCPQNCAAKVFLLAGFQGFRHLQLNDLSFTKSEIEPTPERGRLVAAAAMGKLK